jgi:flagellar hook protein FlgE
MISAVLSTISALQANKIRLRDTADNVANLNLRKKIPEMMITQRTYEANLKVLQTEDNMLGTLLGTIG